MPTLSVVNVAASSSSGCRSRRKAVLSTLICLALAPALTGCSLLLIRRDKHREESAYKVIYSGASRSDVVGALGQPDASQTIDGQLTDTFFVPAHYPDWNKNDYGQAFVGDFQLMFLPELLLVPAELAAHTNKCEYRLSYDKDDRVQTIQCYRRLSCGQSCQFQRLCHSG
jgi:outer membrane protein assembly factor BamE (lipoprotein component of BamABCDE complex)